MSGDMTAESSAARKVVALAATEYQAVAGKSKWPTMRVSNPETKSMAADQRVRTEQ